MDEMIGRLFYRKVSVSEIKAMPYSEMKYWNDWCLSIDEGLKRASEEAKGAK